MAKLALYDNLHNKMVFNMISGDMTTLATAYNNRNSFERYGWCELTPELYLEIGSRYNNYIASMSTMRGYVPWTGFSDYAVGPNENNTMGFTLTALINKGWLDVGTPKNFYFDNELTNYLTITVNGQTSGYNTTYYTYVEVTCTIDGETTQLMRVTGGSIFDFGFVNGAYGGVNGYFFFYKNLFTTAAGTVFRITFKTDDAEDIKNDGGKLDIPNTIDPDKDPLGGWDGDFTPEGDTIDMPDTPDETISGALAHGFLNIYAPTAAQLRTFGGLLWTNAFNVKWYDLDSVSNLVLNAVSDPINYIVGLFMIPVTPATGSSTGIFLGGINANTVAAPRVTSQFKTIDFGTLDVTELYGNYLDYSNSRVSIYLPYIGTADIDIQEIAGGTVSLKYIVDCFTGACVANVHCKKYTETPWGKVYQNETVHSYSGNVAIQLPISAGSFDTMMQGLVNIGLGLGTNTPAVVMQGMTQGVQGFGGDVTTRGSLSSNTGKLCYQTPYLMFTRPIESLPAKNNSLHGWGAGVGGKLGRLKGYVECSDIKLDGVTATDTELTEIANLLKSGVYV